LARVMEVVLEPRKVPVQARSAASVEAILDATVLFLGGGGKERLTTTRVAARAGVSVGTLYQYFPNKSALLQAALERHLGEVTAAVERVAEEQRGRGLRDMVTALMTGFMRAKMRDSRVSAAMYAVSTDVDGARIGREKGMRSNRAIAAMLGSSCEGLTVAAEVAAEMLQGAMVGVSRRLLEMDAPETRVEGTLRELIFFGCAYVEARRG
jgi:AcrR family transcriptional regulator